MKQLLQRTKRRMTSPAFLRMSLAAFVIALCVTQQELLAQRFTNSPALNTAVQGPQANQVEGRSAAPWRPSARA